MIRSQVSRVPRWLWIGPLLASLGCADKPEPVEFFAFVRPKHLAFACYDMEDPDRRVVPFDCCAASPPDTSSEMCGDARLHALVGQTARGEVAAVNVFGRDKGESAVVDSDPVVPGYTFTNVGELPVALVVPRSDPVNPDAGPPWTYVASAGERQVRAVATCRFRLGDQFRVGQRCGPQSTDEADGGTRSTVPDEQTVVALPSEPVDMVLDGSGYLWLSLPEEDALGRIRLNDGSQLPEGGAADPNSLEARLPFLPDENGEYLKLFKLSGDLPAQTLDLVEDSAYTAWCGLGSTSAYGGDSVARPPASLVDLSDAGVDGGLDAGADSGLDADVDGGLDAGGDAGSSGSRVMPGRLRYDSESGLLLASDTQRPLIHAWQVGDEEPVAVASIVTGAPIRDFAVTAKVPASVELYKPDGEANITVEGDEVKASFPPNDTRYVYAIDDRDGTILAIRWTPASNGNDGRVELVKPQGNVIYEDRLFAPGNFQAIDIIDTRTPGKVGSCVLPNKRDNTPGDVLRGVFVAAANSLGHLLIFDVHDQDLFCEAFGFSGGVGRCDPYDQTQPKTESDNPDVGGVALSAQTNDPPLGLAVRRHSWRLSVATQPDVRGELDELGAITCPEGYLAIDPSDDDGVLPAGAKSDPGEPIKLCVSQDPFMQLNASWSVEYEGQLPGFFTAQGAFEGEGSVKGGKATFTISAGFDACARGVVGKGQLPLPGGATPKEPYPGDFLVLTRDLPAGAPEDCKISASAEPPRFPILEAYASRFVVGERVAGDAADGRMTLREAVRCFGPPSEPAAVATGLSAFGVSVQGRHLVSNSVSGVLNRMKANDVGECVADDAQDERLRARILVAETEADCENVESFMVTPYAAFCPKVRDPGDNPELLNVQLTVGTAPVPVDVELADDATYGRARLPDTLRYLPETRQIYVVDSADEGLLQVTVRPVKLENAFR